MSLESRARHATSLITCNASRAPSDTGFKRRVSQSPGDFPFHLCPREPFALLTDSIRNSEIRNFAYSFHDPSSNKSPIYFACVKLGQDSARGGAFPKLCSAVFDICGGTELLLLWSWYLVFPQPKHFHTPEHEPILCPSLITTIVFTNRPQHQFFFFSLVTHKHYHIRFRRFRIRKEWYLWKPGWVRVWESSAPAA